ncbi:TetR/AcrR family transcriptional regulator [Pseudofrankia inefficax]|uniref:Regulatory protein TetR n=1 Tax=Pseudofrankia inefficax (strain DSM 45817 / CECT 9037 / DDB 130130 / EuI1c) TaxID=298654 RepID=E3J2N2_PSEI1|nr:TetR/AcrR family transcriptional regulator [Pseudofrankia inefficax]ADP80546.1 regulatory protein TetR [Pseudofrankia inefficax]
MAEGAERAEPLASIPNATRGWQGAARNKRRGTGRTSRGRQTRDQLLDAARVVFERDGFLQARVADICDEAGVSHGSFYTYFVSKEEIFRTLVDSIELDLLTVEHATDNDHDPVERIRAANEHYLRTYAANAGIMRVIHQVATIDVEVWRTRFQRQDAFAHAIERRIRALQASGLADPAIEPYYAAQALGGMVAYFAELLFNSHDPVNADTDTAIEALTRIWLNALGIREKDTQ